MSRGYYVCQRAAQAIIAEIGPIRVSSDALQAFNLFIDEFLTMLLISANSLDLVRLKAAVIQLLPYSLGKNALVEAEIELKQQVESDQMQDFSTYEALRTLDHISIDKVIPRLQQACADCCTLSSEDDRPLPSPSDPIHIAPIVVIYVTAIVEHIAEYILNSVAMTADQTDAEHIRVKEVLLTLLEDPQVGSLFQRMRLKEKLEKRASTYPNYSATLPSPAPSPISTKRDQIIQRHSTSTVYHSFNLDYNYQGENHDLSPRATPSSNCSIRSSESISDRPLSIISNGTAKSSGSKSRFNFFKKENRNSISLSFSSKQRSNPPSIASPTTPSYTTANIDFEDLIKSGGTKKVSLTPNRLRSIEVKEDQVPTSLWGKPSTKNRIKKKPSEFSLLSSSPPPPIPPLPKILREQSNTVMADNSATNSPPLTPASSVASRPSQRSRQSIIYEEKSTRSSVKSFSTAEDPLTEETHSILMRNTSRISTSSSLCSRRSTTSTDENNTPEQKPTLSTTYKGRFERPSSMVAKRTSMGSRPPSFHEGTFDLLGSSLMAPSSSSSAIHHGSGGSFMDSANKALDDFRYRNVKRVDLEEAMASTSLTSSVDQEQLHNMIYVVPASTIPRPPASGRFAKSRAVSRGCQTEPIRRFYSTHQKELESNDEDEEWFLEEEEEEDWIEGAEEEKAVAEWLLG